MSAVRTHSMPSVVVIRFFIGEQDGIYNRVGPLSGFDGLRECFFTAVVHAVREDDERLSPLLFAHQLVGGKINGVVEQCSCAPPAATAASPAASLVRAPAALRAHLRSFELLQRGLQLWP